MKIIKKNTVLFLSVIQLYSCKQNVDSQIKSNTIQGEHINYSFENLLPKSTINQVVHRDHYVFSYDENAEQAEWLAYELNSNQLINNDFKRPYFIEDPLVETKSADWRNYKNSGYDKGHLCPAADMEFDIKAYEDTFYTSNISPQNHGFNAGIWNRLEQKVRYWAREYETVFVITAGVLKGNQTTIGHEKVKVPNYFYKIIVTGNGNNLKTIAFLIPNKASDLSLYEYIVSIDEIEAQTGIDFFPKLEDSLENKIESEKNPRGWLSK
jgi:endonuclease G, mitochondrial